MARGSDFNRQCARALSLAVLLSAVSTSGQDNFKEVESAARKNDPQAQYKMGWFYSVGYDKAKPNMTTAVDWYKKAANGGMAEAQYKLGYIYDPTTTAFKPIKKDYRLAIDWYRKAEAANVAAAKYALAQLYKDPASGLADTRGYTEQIRLLQEAAKQGMAAAQAELALFYRDGKGDLGKDQTLCMAWAILAAAQGDRNGERICRDLPTLFKMPAADIPKAQKAAELLQKEIQENLKNVP